MQRVTSHVFNEDRPNRLHPFHHAPFLLGWYKVLKLYNLTYTMWPYLLLLFPLANVAVRIGRASSSTAVCKPRPELRQAGMYHAGLMFGKMFSMSASGLEAIARSVGGDTGPNCTLDGDVVIDPAWRAAIWIILAIILSLVGSRVWDFCESFLFPYHLITPNSLFFLRVAVV